MKYYRKAIQLLEKYIFKRNNILLLIKTNDDWVAIQQK